MATVTGLTAARMLAIEAASVVDGDVVVNNLILTKHDGSTIDAGNVRGPTGATGTSALYGTYAARPAASPALEGQNYYATDKFMRWVSLSSVWVLIGTYAPQLTSFPSSPVDGQEFVYKADASRPANWRLRWNAATSKWDVTGAVHLFAAIAGGVSVTSAAAAYQTGGPSIVTPVGAKVRVRWGGDINLSTAGMYGRIGLHIAGVLSETCEATTDATGGAWNGWISVMKEIETTVGASVTLDLRYLRSTANTMQVAKTFLTIDPITV